MVELLVGAVAFEVVVGTYFVGGRTRLSAVSVAGTRIVLTWNVPEMPLDSREVLLVSSYLLFIEAGIAQGLIESVERFNDNLFLARLQPHLF